MEGRDGSIVTLSYLGGWRVVPNYNVMGVAKAALENQRTLPGGLNWAPNESASIASLPVQSAPWQRAASPISILADTCR